MVVTLSYWTNTPWGSWLKWGRLCSEDWGHPCAELWSGPMSRGLGELAEVGKVYDISKTACRVGWY